MKLSKHDKLIMIGDSITDCDRARPRGEGRNESYGRGYAAFVEALLGAQYPELGIRTINMGISGNTVRDLKARWQTDVLDLNPDWLSILIGINDVWRQYDVPKITEQHVYLEEYETTLLELALGVRPQLKGLVLMSPFYLEANPQDPMRRTMDAYGQAVKRVAAEAGAIFVDTQAAFAPLLEHIYPAALAWDRVHPNFTGHMALAKAFLNAVGFEWKA